MVIAVERSHQGPDRGSSVGLYRPIKGHLMAGRHSGQASRAGTAVLGSPAQLWGPIPPKSLGFMNHHTHPLLPAPFQDDGSPGVCHPSPSLPGWGSDPNPLGWSS